VKRPALFLLTLAFPLALFAESPFAGRTNDEILSKIDLLVKNRSKDKPTLTAMAALLDNPDASVNVRERAAWAIGQLEFTPETNRLIKAAGDKGLLVRSAALNALIRMRARSAYPVMLQIAKSDPVLSLRQRAVLGMGLLRWEKAVNDLAALSSDERPEVRAAAALAMAATHSKKNDFTQILNEMKTDQDAFVQTRAQVGLDIAQGKKAALFEDLESEDADTRLFTAQYFRYSGTSSDLKKLKGFYDGEPDDNVRAELLAATRAIDKRQAQAKAKKTTPAGTAKPKG
jgi:HEAT repeat protein